MELIKEITSSLLNLIYNQKCLICSCAKTTNYLCKSCLKDVEMLSGFEQRIFNNIPIYCAYIYSKNIKKLIQLLKFSHKKKAAYALAHLLFNYYKKLDRSVPVECSSHPTSTPAPAFNKNFIIIYPPTFFLKNASRGYEPLREILNKFSKLTNLSVENNLIKKIKYTKPQYKARNRKTNVKGSFSINKKLIEKYKDKNLLLIDDIITSGATIEELIGVLKKAGINNITVLVISKAGV